MGVGSTTYSTFSQDVEKNIQPFREERSTTLGQIKPTNTPKLNTQALEEDGKKIGHQNDEQ
jgi:hypothetical protein